jgi:predicted nucleic acid-binding protein
MNNGVIVCDAGPLIALSLVRNLDLLHRLYDRVLVPEAVVREVVESGAGRADAIEVEAACWLEHVPLDAPPEPLLAKELGVGEAAVITVAWRLGATLVLLDERRARRIAEQAYGLRVKGSAGILIAAKRANLIPAVRPLLEAMANQGYFLSRRLVERACQEVGETIE